ncbi:DUF3530 family protein [Alishewanella tabrizica]|uniref:DUF3530 family protein n=1 Tax=Alishewanella tabrizica TaxID=671278 RepID=A0ABQ2WKS5_9ALTE|nr:DUF3530 family protein [Alishewanella tabrizica]GGW55833.1 hypothetical protein GCM10008111_10000 [Alishewanella tabrizica]
MGKRYNCLFPTIIFYLATFQVSAEITWLDLQRQIPDLQLQTFESANLTVTVHNAQTAVQVPRGTVVILPDQQQHALSPDLLNTLRLNLPIAGWNLIILPAPDALPAQTTEQRLQLQKSQLSQRWQLIQQQGNLRPPVIAIAQGEVAAVLRVLLGEDLSNRPAAMISLGAYLPNYEQHKQALSGYASVSLPFLDLITAQDHPHAMAALEQRITLAKQTNNPLYRQRYLADAYHNASMQQWFANEILGWLKTNGF